MEMTKLLCPHREGAGSPHPIRVGGPDLWYQMALVDTTVEQSLVSSAGGTMGRECVKCEGGSRLWHELAKVVQTRISFTADIS